MMFLFKTLNASGHETVIDLLDVSIFTIRAHDTISVWTKGSDAEIKLDCPFEVFYRNMQLAEERVNGVYKDKKDNKTVDW